MRAHTQTSIPVYITYDEKRRIRLAAQSQKKSMTRFLLDLFLEWEKEQTLKGEENV